MLPDRVSNPGPPQTYKSWHDYRALNQNWSYQPTLAGHSIVFVTFLNDSINAFER